MNQKNNIQSISGREEQNQSEAETKKIRKIIIETAAVTLFVALVAGGIFWAWFKIQQGRERVAILQDQIAQIKKPALENPGEITVNSGDFAAATTAAPADDYSEEYKGWETYTNFEAGYELRYPSTWKVREISGISQMMGDPVNYIMIDAPKKRFTLQWALRNTGENVRMSERTGIGAGEKIPDGKIEILGNEIDINLFNYDGKADEILYPSTGITSIDGGKRQMLADFSTNAGTNADLKIVPERHIAEKILRSVRLIARKKATCQDSLTAADTDEMKDWGIFTNAKYGFSFRYPESWDKIVSDGSADYVSLDDNTFQFRSGPMSATDFMGYSLESQMDAKIACEKGKRSFLCGDPSADPSVPKNQCITMAQFEKNNVPHLVTFFFKNMGASLSGIYTDTFDLILKSMKFY